MGVITPTARVPVSQNQRREWTHGTAGATEPIASSRQTVLVVGARAVLEDRLHRLQIGRIGIEPGLHVLRPDLEDAAVVSGGRHFRRWLVGERGASEILISDSVPGQALLVVAGSGSSRLFRLARTSGPRSTTVLSGMTLDNGHAGDGGALHADDENLVVRNAVFSGNAADARGGAIRVAKGDLTLENVTFIGNRAGPGVGGGAIDFGNGMLRLLRCVVRETMPATAAACA